MFSPSFFLPHPDKFMILQELGRFRHEDMTYHICRTFFFARVLHEKCPYATLAHGRAKYLDWVELLLFVTVLLYHLPILCDSSMGITLTPCTFSCIDFSN